MKRLCIIPCGAKKIWDKYPNIGPSQARDVYISPFGKACQAYADQFFDNWVILSAKHGFLYPTDIVKENYDLSFSSNSNDIIKIEELREQLTEKELTDFDEIVVLGGKKHRKVIEQLFRKAVIQYPLSACKGIGYMLQKLNHALVENEEIHS